MKSADRTPGTARAHLVTQATLVTSSLSLPAVASIKAHSLQNVLSARRSIRSFSQRELTREQLAQLLWAAQGVSDPNAGLRVAPSAGALYPLRLDAVIAAGIFRYEPYENRLWLRAASDRRGAIAEAAYGQRWLALAPCLLSLAAIVERTAGKYGARAQRFVDLEAGHTAQNVLLVATALGLGATPVGAFDDATLARLLELEPTAQPIYLIAVGSPLD